MTGQVINTIGELPAVVGTGLVEYGFDAGHNVQQKLKSAITGSTPELDNRSLGATLRDSGARNFSSPIASSFSLLAADAAGITDPITRKALAPDAQEFLQATANKYGPGSHAVGGSYQKVYNLKPTE
jgi:hypothetical protein